MDASVWGYPVIAGLIGLVAGILLARHFYLFVIVHGAFPKWSLSEKFCYMMLGREGKILKTVKRQKAEIESLRHELRQFSSVLNIAPFPVWRRDKELNVHYCNLAYSALLEEVPERILEEYGLELSEQSREAAQTALSGKQLVSDRRHMIIDGERKLYEAYEIPDVDLGGTVGFAVDISNQEHLEEELRRYMRAQSEMLEASHMATVIFGADKRLKFYNSAFIQMWKLEEEWLEGQPTYGELVELLREKRRMPEVVNFQLFKQQRMKLFTDLMEPMEDITHLPDGKVLRVVIIPHALGGLVFSYEDVTDKVTLERSYNTLIAVQSETLNNLHEGVAVFGEDGRLKLSNPVYAKLWGLSREFLSGDPHIGEVLEQTKHFYQFSDWSEFKTRMTSQLHVRKMTYQRIERTDGSVIDWSTVPLPDGATLITYFDVTDSTLVERSLIDKNEALREADHLKTEFLLSVSYELRSPLTSINGFSEILKEQYFGELNERQREYVDGIYDSARQLEQLINNILDLASIEAGYMRLEIKECNMETLLNDSFALVKDRAKEGKIKLTLDIAPKIGTVQADEVRIKQVLFNLLNNAVKYTPEGGKVTLGVKAEEDSENIMLWVKDTGMGISEVDQKSVFEHFRAGAIRTNRSGAGLGLAMVKNFIELHGGRVELTSEVGKGTMVCCFLPRKHPIAYNSKTMDGGSGSPLAAHHKNGVLAKAESL